MNTDIKRAQQEAYSTEKIEEEEDFKRPPGKLPRLGHKKIDILG
jgi:hypothetical protein